MYPACVVKTSCTSSFLPVNVKRRGESGCTKEKGEEKPEQQWGWRHTSAVSKHPLGVLSAFQEYAVTAAHCESPHDLAGALTPPARMAHHAMVRVLAYALPLVRYLRHQVRRQECLT